MKNQRADADVLVTGGGANDESDRPSRDCASYAAGATFVNATDTPTILMLGGSLTLRDCTVQETTGI